MTRVCLALTTSPTVKVRRVLCARQAHTSCAGRSCHRLCALCHACVHVAILACVHVRFVCCGCVSMCLVSVHAHLRMFVPGCVFMCCGCVHVCSDAVHVSMCCAWIHVCSHVFMCWMCLLHVHNHVLGRGKGTCPCGVGTKARRCTSSCLFTRVGAEGPGQAWGILCRQGQ